MTNNKQSSVEWLISQLKISTYWNNLISELELMECGEIDILEQAKAMHKEEIVEAWDNAAIDATYGNKFSSPTQYYNEHYGNN